MPKEDTEKNHSGIASNGPQSDSTTATSAEEGITDQSQTDSCPECNGNIILQQRRYICSDCGLVISTPSTQGEKSGGEPPEKPDLSPKTVIPSSSDEAGCLSPQTTAPISGKEIPERFVSQKRTLPNLSRGDLGLDTPTTITHTSSSERVVLSELSRIETSLNLPENVSQVATALSKQVLSSALSSIYCPATIASSVTYLAAFIEDFYLTLEDILTVSHADAELLTASIEDISDKFSVKYDTNSLQHLLLLTSSKLDLSSSTREAAQKCLQTATKHNIHSGVNRGGVIAAVIYTAARESSEKVTQSEIADLCSVSVPTLHRRLQDLENVIKK
jgi:transcription initiation factor TFIIB